MTESTLDRVLYGDTHPTRTHIPRGVADYFWSEALERRRLEADLLALFRTWGYSDVIPPTFEYADTFAARANQDLLAALYRMPDRDGSTLALRMDMTIPLARLVGTRLHDWPMPQRYCYTGSVFRYTEPQAGRQREFWQAGIECIGSGTPQADAEVIALAARALSTAGLSEFRLVIGQMQFFYGLLQDLQLPGERQAALQRAVDRNSDAELLDFLRDTPLRTQQRRTIEELPFLSGAGHAAIIDQAERVCLNTSMHAALANLRAICDVLSSHDLSSIIHVDLTEIQNLGYYTGITFEVLTPGLGFPVASGGRYDNLIRTYGPDLPAVGWAVGLDRLLLARSFQRGAQRQPQPVPVDCVVAAASGPECAASVEMLRRSGCKVAVDVDGLPLTELFERSGRLGVRHVIEWQGNGFTCYNTGAADPPSARFVPLADQAALLQLVQVED